MATRKKSKPRTKAAAKKSAKKSAKKVVKLAPKKAAVPANGLRRPSTKPWGGAGKALDGVRILDLSHVQAGPTCTQLLAWFGADVIKVERPGTGDITRGQLRDVPNADSLYYTMLNHNKRSITLDTKHPKGKQVLERLVKSCDVLVENFGPGVLERMGYTWEHIQELNPRMIVASKGLRSGAVSGLQGLREHRAMRGRGGVDHGVRRRPAARDRRPDRRQRHRPASRHRHRVRALSA